MVLFARVLCCVVMLCSYHHLHCDTPLDLHSPYEGFYHAHMGWLFRKADVERPLLDRANVQDLAQHKFYRLMEATWVPQMLTRFFATWVSEGAVTQFTLLSLDHTAVSLLKFFP